MPKKVKAKTVKLNITRKRYISRLPEKSFAKVLLSKFKSRKDLNYEQTFIRFSEDKSLCTVSSGGNGFGTNRSRIKSTYYPGIIKYIAEKNNYNLEKATLIHQHPYSKNEICFISIGDLKSAISVYIQLGIKKHIIVFPDRDNIKERARIHYFLDKDIETSIKNKMDRFKINDNNRAEFIEKTINKISDLFEYEPKTAEDVVEYLYKISSMFHIKTLPLNGYRLDPSKLTFVK